MENITVIVRSWLNSDGFECNGRAYNLNEISQLKKVIGDKTIEWVQGKNTFTGKPVDNEFFESMKQRVEGE